MGAAAAAIGSMAASKGSDKIGAFAGSLAQFMYEKNVVGPALKKIGLSEYHEAKTTERQIGAAQQVAYSKANVRTDVGTPLVVAGDTAARGELAALNALFSREWQRYSRMTAAKSNLLFSALMIGASMGESALDLNRQNQTSAAMGSYPVQTYRASMGPGGSEWNRALSGVYSPDWLR